MLQFCNVEVMFIFVPSASIVNGEVVVCKMYPVDLCCETYVSDILKVRFCATFL